MKMIKLDLEMLSTPNPFEYFWGKKNFRFVLIWLVNLCALVTAIFAVTAAITDILEISCWFLLFASVEAIITIIVVMIIKNNQRHLAINAMVTLGACAEFYHGLNEDESTRCDLAFMDCIKALENGRGRPWIKN